jgi:hypothetical protein
MCIQHTNFTQLQVCRKMGILKWPYQKLKPIERKLQRLRSQVDMFNVFLMCC